MLSSVFQVNAIKCETFASSPTQLNSQTFCHLQFGAAQGLICDVAGKSRSNWITSNCFASFNSWFSQGLSSFGTPWQIFCTYFLFSPCVMDFSAYVILPVSYTNNILSLGVPIFESSPPRTLYPPIIRVLLLRISSVWSLSVFLKTRVHLLVCLCFLSLLFYAHSISTSRRLSFPYSHISNILFIYLYFVLHFFFHASLGLYLLMCLWDSQITTLTSTSHLTIYYILLFHLLPLDLMTLTRNRKGYILLSCPL
jgi:hypothetical protein